MSAPIRTPASQLLDNSGSLMSLIWTHFPLIWSIGNLLVGNFILETVPELVTDISTRCCFDEIKKLTKFDFKTLHYLEGCVF